MPNWCENILTIKPESILEEIAKKYLHMDKTSMIDIFDFNMIIPIEDTNQDDNWHHEERVNKWGTKWCPDNIKYQSNYIKFTTAWVPPIPVVRKLAFLYPSAQFILDYNELETDLKGIYYARVDNGKITEKNFSWDNVINFLLLLIGEVTKA